MTREQIVSTQYIRLLYGHGTKIPYAHTHLSCIFMHIFTHSFRSINRQLLADGRSACAYIVQYPGQPKNRAKTKPIIYSTHSSRSPPAPSFPLRLRLPRKWIEYIRSFSVFSLLDNTNLYVNRFSFTFSFQILSAVEVFVPCPIRPSPAPVFHFR